MLSQLYSTLETQRKIKILPQHRYIRVDAHLPKFPRFREEEKRKNAFQVSTAENYGFVSVLVTRISTFNTKKV